MGEGGLTVSVGGTGGSSSSTGQHGGMPERERHAMMTPGSKSTISNVVNESGEVKPRSLRFTWSMKTTSSRDPNEIMAEIKKVSWKNV